MGVSNEDLVFDPKIIDNTNAPWQMSIETQIIFGKNSRGYVFQCIIFFLSFSYFFQQDKTQENRAIQNDQTSLKKMLFTLREYEERNKKLEAQVHKYETELYGKSADKYATIEVNLFTKTCQISIEKYTK